MTFGETVCAVIVGIGIMDLVASVARLLAMRYYKWRLNKALSDLHAALRESNLSPNINPPAFDESLN